MGDGPGFYGSPWRDPERWRALTSGEVCPIYDGKPYGIVAELDASYLTTARDTPFRGYCCLVLKRHAVELHDLGDAEAFSLMGDMRRVSRALKDVTGAVKINVDIHGNTLPHLHAHFFPATWVTPTRTARLTSAVRSTPGSSRTIRRSSGGSWRTCGPPSKLPNGQPVLTRLGSRLSG